MAVRKQEFDQLLCMSFKKSKHIVLRQFDPSYFAEPPQLCMSFKKSKHIVLRQ